MSADFADGFRSKSPSLTEDFVHVRGNAVWVDNRIERLICQQDRLIQVPGIASFNASGDDALQVGCHEKE
jgi:hypothetical protein